MMLMAVNLKFFIVVILIGSFSSCKMQRQVSHEETAKEADYALLKYSEFTVIDNSGLDGCAFMLKGMNNIFLEPVNLPDSLRIDKLKLWIKFVPAKGHSVCMAGELITITDIRIKK